LPLDPQAGRVLSVQKRQALYLDFVIFVCQELYSLWKIESKGSGIIADSLLFKLWQGFRCYPCLQFPGS
jgi:hypothetical protein